MATKAQLAWRKKFAALAKKGKLKKGKKKKTKVSGTTSIKIPTKRKSKTVHVKRASTGRFSMSGDTKVKLKDYEYEIGLLIAKLKFDKTANASQKKVWRKKIAGYKTQHSALTKYYKTLQK